MFVCLATTPSTSSLLSDVCVSVNAIFEIRWK
jgi:hypothetical protein